MKFVIPSRNDLSRLLMVALGIAILVWSGMEDHDVITVTALGWLLSLVTVALYLMSRFGGRALGLPELAFSFGAAVGAFSSVMTVLLMLFKDLRHGHVYPDYPPQLMLAILERLPIWTLAGGLAGLGLGLLLGLLANRGDTQGAD